MHGEGFIVWRLVTVSDEELICSPRHGLNMQAWLHRMYGRTDDSTNKRDDHEGLSRLMKSEVF